MTQLSVCKNDNRTSRVFSQIITNDEKMYALFRQLESIAGTHQPLLITGETGVGKELFAKAIHELSGLAGPFVAVNVAGLDDHVFSDTLFGHVKGAYTGADRARQGLVEQAAEGTLFLDEIGDLSLPSQMKLLRLLEEGEYRPLGQDEMKHSNVRVLSATNQDLWSLQRQGRFRSDLNYRLRTHHVNIPPLRERLDDTRPLVSHFVTKAAKVLKRRKPRIPDDLLDILKSYPFPGNVRELEAMIFDAVSRADSDILPLNVIQANICQWHQGEFQPTEENHEGIHFSRERLPTIKEATALLIEEAMKRAEGNQSVAARMLGISQQALSKRLKKSTL